jgi:hypothetical protein
LSPALVCIHSIIIRQAPTSSQLRYPQYKPERAPLTHLVAAAPRPSDIYQQSGRNFPAKLPAEPPKIRYITYYLESYYYIWNILSRRSYVTKRHSLNYIQYERQRQHLITIYVPTYHLAKWRCPKAARSHLQI